MVSAAGAVLRGEPVETEHAQVGDVGEQVHRHDHEHAEHQRARQRALGRDDLLGDEVGLLPAAVGEEDRHQRRAQGGERRGRAVARAGAAGIAARGRRQSQQRARRR